MEMHDSTAKKEAKENYHLAWQDWYYWPMSDEKGQEEARIRVEEAATKLRMAK